MIFNADSFNSLQVPEDVLPYLEIQNGALQVKQNAIGKTNLLENKVVTPIAPAVINGTITNPVDMKDFTGAFVSAGVGEVQAVSIDLTALEVINHFFIKHFLNEEDSLNSFMLELSEDNINWYPAVVNLSALEIDLQNPEPEIWVIINNLDGIKARYLRLTFAGTEDDPLKTTIMEVQAWAAEYHAHHVDTVEEIFLYFDFEDKFRTDVVASFTEDATVTASEIRYQISINNVFYYYNTTSTLWERVSTSKMFWVTEANTAAELTGPVLANLPTNSQISQIGVRTMLVPISTETPVLRKVTLT